jgi:hypothetical protein
MNAASKRRGTAERMDANVPMSLAETDPDDLAVYEAGRPGGPRPPLSFDWLMRKIVGTASAMLSRESPDYQRSEARTLEHLGRQCFFDGADPERDTVAPNFGQGQPALEDRDPA